MSLIFFLRPFSTRRQICHIKNMCIFYLLSKNIRLVRAIKIVYMDLKIVFPRRIVFYHEPINRTRPSRLWKQRNLNVDVGLRLPKMLIIDFGFYRAAPWLSICILTIGDTQIVLLVSCCVVFDFVLVDGNLIFIGYIKMHILVESVFMGIWISGRNSFGSFWSTRYTMCPR